MLQLGDRVRRPHVLFAAHAERVLAARVQRVRKHRVDAEGGLVDADRLFRHLEHADALDVGGRAGEVFVYQRPGETDRLEDLRAGVRHVSRDAHLGHHLPQPLADRLDVILDRLAAVEFGGQRAVHGEQRLKREIRVHRFRAIGGEQREMVHFARRAGLNHQARAGAQALGHQVLVDRRKREQRRDRHPLAVDPAVGNDDDRVARAHRVLGLRAERREPCLDRLLAPGDRIADVEFAAPELAFGVALDVPDLLHFEEVEHRLADLEPDRRIGLVDAEQVGLRADERHQRHHQLLADRIDRGVGDLCEELLEVVVERLVFVRQHRERRIVAHRADRLLGVDRHRRHQQLDVLLRIGERLLAVKQRHGAALRLLLVAFDIVELDADAFDPLAVGLRRGERVLELLVVDDAALLQVNEEHATGLQPPLLDNVRFGYRQAAALRAHDHEIVFGDDVARRP